MVVFRVNSAIAWSKVQDEKGGWALCTIDGFFYRIVHIGSGHIIRIPLNHVQHVLFSVLALQYTICDDINIIITALDKLYSCDSPL